MVVVCGGTHGSVLDREQLCKGTLGEGREGQRSSRSGAAEAPSQCEMLQHTRARPAAMPAEPAQIDPPGRMLFLGGCMHHRVCCMLTRRVDRRVRDGMLRLGACLLKVVVSPRHLPPLLQLPPPLRTHTWMRHTRACTHKNERGCAHHVTGTHARTHAFATTDHVVCCVLHRLHAACRMLQL